MRRLPRVGSVVSFSSPVEDDSDDGIIGLIVDVEVGTKGTEKDRYWIRWADEPGKPFGRYLRSDVEVLCW